MKKTNPMKKTILALALAAGLTSFAGNAKATIVFQEFNQSIADGQPYSFGFNGSSITSGSGDYSLTYSPSKFYPAETDSWTYEGVDYSYTFPAYTSPISLLVDDAYTQSATALYPGTQGNAYGPNPQQGNAVSNYNRANQVPQGTYYGESTYGIANTQNQAIWLAFMPNANNIYGGYSGWAEFSFNNAEAVLGAVAFATSGDITIGDTGNGMYNPVVLQDVSPAAVPEPSQVAASLLLVGGIAGFVIVRRRKALALALAA